jgi:xanthine dehydrogenase YagR molybdenum-binding subunit
MELSRRQLLGATAGIGLLRPALAQAPQATGEGLALRTQVNGKTWEGVVDPEESALEWVRDRLGLTGSKEGCGHGACGACTLLVNDTPVSSCLMPACHLEGKQVRTVEGLGGDHPIQRAFAAEDALQCGYCTPGFVVEASRFYDRWKAAGGGSPSRDEVAAALAGHLCRCGAYPHIYAAVIAACEGKYDVDTGAAPPRQEAFEKVTGKAKYTVDIQLPGQLHAVILRSPYGHARLDNLDSNAAEKMPGIEAVYRFPVPEKLLRFAGQEILAIAGQSRPLVEAAARAVKLDWTPLPVVVGMDAAMKPDATLVYENPGKQVPSSSEGPAASAGWTGNVRGPAGSDIFLNDGGATRAIAAARAEKSSLLAEGVWETQAECHSALEPHAVVAHWEAGKLTVYLSTQAVEEMAKDLEEYFDLPSEKVEVIAEHVGGAFGAKLGFFPELIAAVELSKLAGKPVRLALSRYEELAVGGYRPGVRTRLAVLDSGEGALDAMEAHAYADAGVAMGSSLGVIFRILYPSKKKEISDYDVVTHAAGGRPFRGPGAPPAAFAIEGAVDQLAVARGLDPIALRRRWDPNPIRGRLYDQVEKLPLWQNRPGYGAEKGRFRRGVGLAVGAWPSFVQVNVRLRVETQEDGSLRATTSGQDVGTGTRSVIASGLEKIFGVPIDVELGHSGGPPGPMSAGSRTVVSLVPALLDGAERLKKAVLAEAQKDGKRYEVVEGGLSSAAGVTSWRELFRKHRVVVEGIRKPDEGGYFLPVNVVGMNVVDGLGGTVCLAEVEVDTETGKVRVLQLWQGVGVGKIATPLLARTQVEGAMVQGLGYALYEERRLDPSSGGHLTRGLEDFRIPGIGDIPPVEVVFDEEGFERVPGGGVGLGEIAKAGVAASIANAVAWATGWRPTQLPIRPDRVIAGLRGGAQ